MKMRNLVLLNSVHRSEKRKSKGNIMNKQTVSLCCVYRPVLWLTTASVFGKVETIYSTKLMAT